MCSLWLCSGILELMTDDLMRRAMNHPPDPTPTTEQTRRALRCLHKEPHRRYPVRVFGCMRTLLEQKETKVTKRHKRRASSRGFTGEHYRHVECSQLSGSTVESIAQSLGSCPYQ